MWPFCAASATQLADDSIICVSHCTVTAAELRQVLHGAAVNFHFFLTWVWVNTYRYIFSGMNIHLPAILGFTRYQGFDPSPLLYLCFIRGPFQNLTATTSKHGRWWSAGALFAGFPPALNYYDPFIYNHNNHGSCEILVEALLAMQWLKYVDVYVYNNQIFLLEWCCRSSKMLKSLRCSSLAFFDS